MNKNVLLLILDGWGLVGNLVNTLMNILEIFDSNPSDYSTEKEDNTVPKLSDLRKTKITLKQLNRLRIMNDVRKLEHEQKLETVKNQYKQPAAQAPMM